jgi:hypothetical protein
MNIFDITKKWIPKTSKRKVEKYLNDGNFSSLHGWLGLNLPHGDNVKSGYLIEYYFRYLIEKSILDFELFNSKHDKKIKVKSSGKNKQIDLLFLNKKNNILYYREIKTNIKLDTDKAPANSNKVNDVHLALQEKYPNYTINSCVLVPTKINILNKVKQEGFNDFLQKIGYSTLSIKEYENLGVILGQLILQAFNTAG